MRSAECGMKLADSSRKGLRTPHSALRTRILGPLSHVGDALAAADVLAIPSRYEGMPLALIEAWLAGTPAVTTPIGFVREAEAMHGTLCEVAPQDPSAALLAGAIQRAANAPHASLRTAHARKIAWQYYTAAAMAQRWEEFLHEAVRIWDIRHRVKPTCA